MYCIIYYIWVVVNGDIFFVYVCVGDFNDIFKSFKMICIYKDRYILVYIVLFYNVIVLFYYFIKNNYNVVLISFIKWVRRVRFFY